MTTNEINAYIAGIFDGEGCIGIYRRVRVDRKNPEYPCELRISNTNKNVIEFIKRHFKEGLVYTWIGRSSTRRQMWSWEVRGKKAMNFLQTVYPYLVIKKDQAKIAIEFVKRFRKNARGRTPAEIQWADAQVTQIGALKH